MKKLMCMLVLLISVLFVVACSSETTSSVDEGGLVNNDEGVDDVLDEFPESEVQKPIVSDEMDRYASFEAKLACELMLAGMNDDQEAFMAVLASTPSYAEEFGLTEEDINRLTPIYKEDTVFMSVVKEKMESFCPDALVKVQ